MTDVAVACAGVGDGWLCSVRVADDRGTAEHEVTIRDVDALAHGVVDEPDAERLVTETFAFLLERESRESILPRFHLGVVEHYFPEFPDAIRGRLQR